MLFGIGGVLARADRERENTGQKAQSTERVQARWPTINERKFVRLHSLSPSVSALSALCETCLYLVTQETSVLGFLHQAHRVHVEDLRHVIGPSECFLHLH